jgi:hypothetical protein
MKFFLLATALLPTVLGANSFAGSNVSHFISLFSSNIHCTLELLCICSPTGRSAGFVGWHEGRRDEGASETVYGRADAPT